MTKAAVWTLRASAAWSLWVWAVLVRNMLVDHVHSTGFRVVHLVLAVISVAFAVATLVIAQRMTRSLRTQASGAGAGAPVEADPS
jgi:hypothetical protein